MSLLVLSYWFTRPLAPIKYLNLLLDIVLLAVSYDMKLILVYYIFYKKSKLLNRSTNANPRAFC